jgi:RNA polymerase sigma factor (sigma-70 family)
MSVLPDFTDQRVLYQSLRAGQDSAFEHLYKLLYHRIAGYVFASGGSREETKTVVHESIITLVFNLHYGTYEWREETELLTYVTTIARNKWSEMRRQTTRQVSLEVIGAAQTAENPYQTAADEQDFEQRRLALEQHVARLGEKCRRCIELFYFQQKSMHEIAALLGWASDDVAKKEKYRCLQKLRQQLGLRTWAD